MTFSSKGNWRSDVFGRVRKFPKKFPRSKLFPFESNITEFLNLLVFWNDLLVWEFFDRGNLFQKIPTVCNLDGRVAPLVRKRGIYLETQNFCVQMAKEKIFKMWFSKAFNKILW